MIELNAHVREMWLAALRSGEYKQGKDYLRRQDDTFCCLGVLCDLHSKETTIRWKNVEKAYEYLWSSTGIGPEISDWIGSHDWEFFNGTLVQMNDGGSTFAEIAEYIEEYTVGVE